MTKAFSKLVHEHRGDIYIDANTVICVVHTPRLEQSAAAVQFDLSDAGKKVMTDYCAVFQAGREQGMIVKGDLPTVMQQLGFPVTGSSSLN